MIGGSDYVYLTNVEPAKIEPLFLEKLREHWPSPLIETFDRTDDHIELFIAKDEEMRHFNQEHGAVLNENGEGRIMFFAGLMPMHQSDIQVSNVYLLNKKYNVAPHPEKLFLINAWEYTLVLPALIQESKFARKIHEYLMATIAETCKAELAKSGHAIN